MLGKVDIDTALKLNNKIFIDVRSPYEFQEGTMPGAINMPLLDNEERIEIGKIYKQEGKEPAKVRGLEIVSPKLPRLYKELLELTNKHEEIIVFCARGGLRSTSFVNFFNGLGLKIYQLQGGFKTYRNHLLDYLSNIHQHHKFIVLHGFTGVGKTEILTRLKEIDIPILDLEDLANNKGSVFGEDGDQKKAITQKNFENSLLETLMFIKEKYIVVESESQRLGQIRIPKEIFETIKTGKHILIHTSVDVRVGRLVEDYVNKSLNHDDILTRGIQLLRKRVGTEKVELYLRWMKEKNYKLIAQELILDYYDPLYQHSIEKYNYDLEVYYDKIEEAVNQIALYYHQIEGKYN